MFNICKHRIQIADKHLRIRKKLDNKQISKDDIKKKTFRSFDIKYLEQQVNDFLEDAIYVNAVHNSIYYDTSDIPEISDKTDPLYNHIIVVYYVEWPF